MKTLTERMNMKFGHVDNAHVMTNIDLDYASAFHTISLICNELDIDLTDVLDTDFDSASIVLKDFCDAANDDTGYTVSVWFDDQN